MAYNRMHEVQFRDAVAVAADAAVAEARDYWQGLADAGGGPDAQRYAAICRDELKARDNVVPDMKDDALEAGADPRSRVSGKVRTLTDDPTKGTPHAQA